MPSVPERALQWPAGAGGASAYLGKAVGMDVQGVVGGDGAKPESTDALTLWSALLRRRGE